MYRRVLLLIVLAGLAGAWLPVKAQAPAPSAEPGQTTWYFYKVRWGFQDEFLDLFQRNHYPVLKAEMEAGRFTRIRTYVPANHGDGRADWTFAVELVQPPNPPKVDTEAIIAKLYPDREKFRREEQRRFELLDAHWDVPLNVVDLDARKLSVAP